MGSYSFKSAGKTQQQQLVEKLAVTTVPIGIKTPLRLNQSVSSVDNSIFEMNLTLADQIQDNLRNLIQTNWGERLGLYDFGANLRPITTEFVSNDDFDSQAVQRIKGAVTRWMPYVTLDNFLSEVDHVDNRNTGIINITITYSIPSLQVSNKALRVTLYVI